MKNISMFAAKIALAVCSMCVLIGQKPVFAADMVAHKAFYSLKLGAVRGNSDFVGVRGNMELTMEQTCEGWTMSQTLRMDLATNTGEAVEQDLRFTAWESDDGSRYRFFASNNVNGAREDFRGRAVINAPQGEGNANYQIPKDLKIPLPEGTMFPLGHTAWLIDQALAGKRQLSQLVFDGADGEGPQLVTAFIGPTLDPGDGARKDQVVTTGALMQRPGWNIRMGFYQLDSQQSAPDYEVEIFQLDNGVTPTLTLDYQDFSVILNLQHLEEIPQPQCQ